MFVEYTKKDCLELLDDNRCGSLHQKDEESLEEKLDHLDRIGRGCRQFYSWTQNHNDCWLDTVLFVIISSIALRKRFLEWMRSKSFSHPKLISNLCDYLYKARSLESVIERNSIKFKAKVEIVKYLISVSSDTNASQHLTYDMGNSSKFVQYLSELASSSTPSTADAISPTTCVSLNYVNGGDPSEFSCKTAVDALHLCTNAIVVFGFVLQGGDYENKYNAFTALLKNMQKTCGCTPLGIVCGKGAHYTALTTCIDGVFYYDNQTMYDHSRLIRIVKRKIRAAKLREFRQKSNPDAAASDIETYTNMLERLTRQQHMETGDLKVGEASIKTSDEFLVFAYRENESSSSSRYQSDMVKRTSQSLNLIRDLLKFYSSESK
jgi:hypothetical protein